MSQHKHTVHATFTGQLASDPGRLQILFIQAGEANGWTFSEQVLRDSAALWDECSVFVDHSMWGGRSVRDLGGVLSNTAWSGEHNGLIAELTPAGPSKEIILEAGRVMFADGARPNIGFSADVVFTADSQNNVQKIMQPLSVDLVVDPAFATKFIRQLNSKKGIPMTDLIPTPAPTADETDVRALLQAQQLEAGNLLLNTALQAAQLPERAEKAIRILFENRQFKPDELKEAINTYSELAAAATGPDEIVGPRRASQMFDSRDQLQAAIDDMVGAPREPGAEGLKVAKFSGIKEAYARFTGDADMVGGFFKDRAQFTQTTATLPGLVANALNKSLAREWDLLGKAGYDWWKKIVTVEHFNSVQDIAWLLFGTIASLPTVSENGEYTELKIGDSKETASFIKYGGYVGLSLEAIDKDDTRKLRAIPRELANAGLRNISALVAAIFTSASGAGPTMADTGALFNATAVTTKGGHKNLLTTALGTDFTAWDAAAKAMYDQPMLIASEDGYWGSGKKTAIEPRYCLVPRKLKAAAEALFIPRWIAAGVNTTTVQPSGAQTYPGYVEPITVPEWTDDTDWAAVADPAIMPGIMIGERFGLLPQIFVAGSETDPAMFSNDESRIKTRHLLAVGVADYRPLHKSNVAG
jgi:hypothetical protein